MGWLSAEDTRGLHLMNQSLAFYLRDPLFKNQKYFKNSGDAFSGIAHGSQFERVPIVSAGNVHQTSARRQKSSKPRTWSHWVYLPLCRRYAILSTDPHSPELFALESS